MAREQRDRRTATLTLPIGPDRERAVRAARRWFELCPDQLHGSFDPANAALSVAVFDDSHPEPWEWSETWSRPSWDEFLRQLGRLPDAAGFEEPRPGFRVGLIAERDHVDLFSTIDDAVTDDQILTTVRAVAEMGAPLAAAVAIQGEQLLMPLEVAISRSNTTYVRRPAETLRNYGWLTVLSDELAERVGGADRLRASGAFVEAEPLAAGGWWLLATKTWDEYGPEQANRLFEILAPVLPPGRPEMTQWRFGSTGNGAFEVTLPNVVAERDPREITG
jgi:hypothetical protein